MTGIWNSASFYFLETTFTLELIHIINNKALLLLASTNIFENLIHLNDKYNAGIHIVCLLQLSIDLGASMVQFVGLFQSANSTTWRISTLVKNFSKAASFSNQFSSISSVQYGVCCFPSEFRKEKLNSISKLKLGTRECWKGAKPHTKLNVPQAFSTTSYTFHSYF